jgi:hypothetical protein
MSKRNAPVADVPVSLDNIEKLYDMDFRGPEERKMVEEFIRANPEIIPLLEEARELVHKYFPDHSPFLEMGGLYDGPAYHHVVVEIPTKLPHKEAWVQFEELGQNWLYLLSPDLRRKFDVGFY